MSCVVFLLVAAQAWAAAPVVFGFEADAATAGWTAAGPSAALSITRDAAQVRRGRGALLCSYTGSPGAPVSLTGGDLDLAGARSLALALRASAQTPFVLRLTEEDGSAYQLFVTCLPDEWSEVSVPLTDLQLEDGSTDENGALDAEQVTTFALQSLANLGGDFAGLFGTQTGPQTLVIDEVAFGTQEVASRSTIAPGKATADGFDRAALHLLPVGGAELTRVAGHQGEAPSALGVRFRFHALGPQAWPGVVVPVGHLDLALATTLRLRLRSLGPLRFHLLAEEQDGSRYETMGALETPGEWMAKDFRLADFTLDPTRQDENGALDPGQLRVLVVVADVYNALLDDRARSEFALDDILLLE